MELDETMGDTATNISDHETSIMLALSSCILEKTVMLLDLSHLISQLDCLLALAFVAKTNDWCRPQINENRMMSIKDGQH